MEHAIRDILGLDTSFYQLAKFAIRAVIVLALALVLVRLNGKRMFNKASAFDFVVAIMIGSIMSRAITNSSPFLPTLLSAAVLMLVHWLLAVIAYRTDNFGFLIKGSRTCLIKDGELQRDAMRETTITERDLLTAARTQAKLESFDKIKAAFLERNGSISIIPYDED